MTPTAIVIFASPAGRPIYISATPNPKAAVEAIRSRWDAATIAATFYAPAATEAHQIASAAAMALPITERKAAIVLRDGGVDEARTLIAQLAKRQGVKFTTERELAADSKRQSDVAAVVTKLRGKQHIGELKPFNQACREQRDRLDGRILSNDAMLRAVAENIVAGRKIKTFDAALVEEILSELAEPAGAIPSAPKRTGAGIANVREPERFPMRGSGNLRNAVSINWNRGAFRVWVLISLAWIMACALYCTISNLHDGLWKAAAIKIPVALCGPPAALLVVGLGTKWAVKGFAPRVDRDLADAPPPG